MNKILHRQLFRVAALLVILLTAAKDWPMVAANAAALGVVRARLLAQPCTRWTRSWLETAQSSVMAKPALRLRAECSAIDRRWVEADADLTQALTRHDPIVLLRRGDARRALGQRAAAINDWRSASAASLLLWRGEESARLIDVEAALEWFRIAADVAPDDGRAYWWMGQEYQHLGRINEAEAAYREAARLIPGDIRIQLSLVGLMSGVRNDQAAALRLLEPIVRRWPDRIEPLLAAGQIESRCGRYDAAAALYARVERVDPASPEPAQLRGLDLLAQGRPLEAVKLFQRAVALSGGTNGFAHYNLAFAYDQAGQTGAATASFERAIETMPRYVPFRMGAGRVYEAIGLPCDALRHYRAALRVEPANARLNEAIERLTHASNCR